jgi:hypothetical protein
MPPDDPAFGHGTAFIGQEDLEEWTFRGACRAFIRQVNLKQAHPDVGEEPDHRRDRPRDHLELGDGVIQRACMTGDLNDQLPRYLAPAGRHPARKGTNVDSAKAEAGNGLKVELPTLLRQESSRRQRPQHHDVLLSCRTSGSDINLAFLRHPVNVPSSGAIAVRFSASEQSVTSNSRPDRHRCRIRRERVAIAETTVPVLAEEPNRHAPAATVPLRVYPLLSERSPALLPLDG